MRTLIMTGAVILAFSVAAASQDPKDVGTVANQTTILWTTIIGLVSLFATQLFSMWREYRDRRWNKEDRDRGRQELREKLEAQRLETEMAREEMREKLEAQRLETIATAVELARRARTNQAQLLHEISENTKLTQHVGEKAEAAYEAGNNFTSRLESLRTELFGKKGQIDHIEEVSEDTNVKVTELKEDSDQAKEGH